MNNSVEASLQTLRPSVHSCTNDRLLTKTQKGQYNEHLLEREFALAHVDDSAFGQGRAGAMHGKVMQHQSFGNSNTPLRRRSGSHRRRNQEETQLYTQTREPVSLSWVSAA